MRRFCSGISGLQQAKRAESSCSGALYSALGCHASGGAASGTPEGAELKFFSSFAHGGGGWQQSEAELPVAGGGASLLYIGALVLKGAMLAAAAVRA